MTHKRKVLLAMPLFLAILIDGMGLGIIFPILSAITTDPHVSILPAATSSSLRNFYYGLTISSFMIAWFFGAAILGDVSDMIGRKKSLMISLIGSAVGFFMTAIAVFGHLYWLLVLGRLIDGFTAGSQSIAQAAVVDISGPKDTTRFLGYILFAASLGFILGPICGGFLSDSSLVSWFDFSVPFYFSGALAIINVLLIQWFYHEAPSKKRKLEINVMHALHLFGSAFKHEKIRKLSVILLLMLLGWSSYYTFVSLFLMHKFHYAPTQISEYLALAAVGFGIGTAYLINVFSKYMSQNMITIIGMLMAAASLLVTITTANIALLWMVSIPMCAGIAISYTALLGLFSAQADETEQGWVMGITQSLGAFAFGLTGFVEAFVSNVSLEAPMIVAILFLVVASVIMTAFRAAPVEV